MRILVCMIVTVVAAAILSTIIASSVVVSLKKKKKHDNAQSQQPQQDQPAVQVSLKAQQGSLFTVQVHNNAGEDINLFKRANILDPNPVLKVNVTSANGEEVRFVGVHARVAQNELSQSSFESVKRGSWYNTTVDLADLYDVSKGGTFEVFAEGGLGWANKKSAQLVGTVPFETNKISMEIPKSLNPKVKTVLQSDCGGSQLDVSLRANAVCAMLSILASTAASRGDPELFFRYFRTYDRNTRNLVSKRFLAVADECAGKTKVSTTFCSDQLKLCQSDYISVTYGTQITNCDIYWRFPVLTDKCHGYDQATLTIHETTHVDGLYDPSTDDFKNNYGWPALTYLSPDQAVRNADNYQYFANAVFVGKGC